MSRNDSTLIDQIQGLAEVIVREVRSNPGFARRLGDALSRNVERASETPRGRHRRNPGAFDPFALYEKSEQELRRGLEQLDLDSLKDIVAAHGMDRAKLAMRWRTESRLVDLIVDTVKTRAHKGDAFRT